MKAGTVEGSGVRHSSDHPARAGKRIVFLSSLHPPLDKRVFEKEAISLAEAGFEVVHVCPAEDWVGHRIVRGVKIITVERRGRSRLSQFLTLFRSARIVASLRPDAIHCNEVDSWIVGAIIAKLVGARCVFDAHEDYDAMVVERTPPALRLPMLGAYRLAKGIAASLTWRIVLAKESIRSEYRRFQHKTITVANYGLLRVADLPPKKSQDGVLDVVHLGVMGRLRGWRELLQALGQCRDLSMRVSIVGTFTDGSEDEFWQEVDRLELRAVVRVMGWLPYEEAYELLLRSDVGLVLFQPGPRNHVRALPHKMFDYMLAENAVIAPGFAPEVATIIEWSAAGILIDPSNPAEIARALRTLADDGDLCRRLGRNGRKAVVERYNWGSEARKLVELYSGL